MFVADANCRRIANQVDLPHYSSMYKGTRHSFVQRFSPLQLQGCALMGKDSPTWRDYLIISPLWSFKKR